MATWKGFLQQIFKVYLYPSYGMSLIKKFSIQGCVSLTVKLCRISHIQYTIVSVLCQAVCVYLLSDQDVLNAKCEAMQL